MKTTLRAKRTAAAIALAIALPSQAGCGVAQRTARSATEGAIGALAGKLPAREHLVDMAEGIKRRAAAGALDVLSQPDQLDDIERIAAAVGSGAVSGASRAASAPAETPRRGTQGATPVDAVAEQAARAFSRQIVEVGRDGAGPLATSLSSVTEQMAESMVRGARGELFPACRGADASGCLDRAAERIGRASSAGVAAGIREALGVWPLVFAFGGGVLSTLVLAWAWRVARARRPAPAS